MSIKPEELRVCLSQCIGTENYWRLSLPKLIYTDGVKMFAEKAERIGF